MKKDTTKKIYFDSEKCLGCHSCELACAVEHSAAKRLLTAHLEEQTPVQRRNVFPVSGSAALTVSCRHCQPAQCMDACISGAMSRKDGYVQCDTTKCVGCRMCVMVCPFDAIKTGTVYVIKCDMCPDRDDFSCVHACPTKALFALTAEEYAAFAGDRKTPVRGGAL